VKWKDEEKYESDRIKERLLEMYREKQEAIRVSAGSAPADSMLGGPRERRDTDVPAGPQRSRDSAVSRGGEYRTKLGPEPGSREGCHPAKATGKA
jgi:hypothetical protein